MSDFLTEMSDSSLLRARSAKERADVSGLHSRVASAPPPRPVEFSDAGFDVIAEAKLASPSEGELAKGGRDRVVELARSYSDNGAAVISVLTEDTRFGGALEHLQAAASSLDVPVMRKDFLVDPVQVLEARAANASGVLLIARLLPGGLLEEMTALTVDLGMFALVEAFDRSDLEAARSVAGSGVLLGVNCRDLATLEVDFSRFAEIAPDLPTDVPVVAESGLMTVEDVSHVAALGYRLALIGSSLVSSGRPGAMSAEFVRAGRQALMGSSS